MDKQYQIRAVYREGIETEPVDVVLETPQQLPNSDMEEWNETTRRVRYFYVFGSKYYDQPFLSHGVAKLSIGGIPII